MDDVKTQEEATGQSFSLGGKKRHNAKNSQSENEQNVPKAHNAEKKQPRNEQSVPKRSVSKMVQLDTFMNTNQIDLLSNLSDGQEAITPAYFSERSP